MSNEVAKDQAWIRKAANEVYNAGAGHAMEVSEIEAIIGHCWANATPCPVPAEQRCECGLPTDNPIHVSRGGVDLKGPHVFTSPPNSKESTTLKYSSQSGRAYEDKREVVADEMGKLLAPDTDSECPDCGAHVVATETHLECAARCGWRVGDPRNEGTKCQSCGKRYKVDLNLPDSLWYRINAQNGIACNLLCPLCIAMRLENLGEFDSLDLVNHMDRTSVSAQTEELLPCPFCGAAGSIYYHGEDYAGSSQVDVGCSGGCEITPRACGDTNPESEQDEKWAIQIWNTRATPTPSEDSETEAREISYNTASEIAHYIDNNTLHTINKSLSKDSTAIGNIAKIVIVALSSRSSQLDEKRRS